MYASGDDQPSDESPDAREVRRKQCLELVEAVEAHRAVQTGEIDERQYTEAMRPAFPDVVDAAEQEAYAGWTPNADDAPVDLDGPAMRAYHARLEREHAAEHPNDVVADTATVDQPRSF